MNKTITFLVDKNNDNMRLDKYLVSKLKKITRSQIKKIIIDKNVSINGENVSSPSQKIKKYYS